MTPVQQRFCPICDRSFIPGEALLRCSGCLVMLHPACWVRNDGCATEGEHARTPEAMAYSRAPVVLFPEGAPPPARPRNEAPAPPRPPLPAALNEPLIGGNAGDLTKAQAPIASDYRPTPPRRYEPAGDGSGSGKKPLPKIYGRRRWAEYWYVPAAALIAVGVAGAVIFLAEWLFGGDDPERRAADDGVTVTPLVDTPTPAPEATRTPSATPTVTPTTGPGTPSPTPAGKFALGDRAVVAGTGDCLRVREGPGLDRPQITCLPDGAPVTIQAGPQTADSLRWWRVATVAGDGWAAEEYLAKP